MLSMAVKSLRPHKPSALEGALLILGLAEAKEANRRGEPNGEEPGDEASGEAARPRLRRFRVSETTLKRVLGRQRIPLDYLAEVQEWLLDAGWALFFAGSSYAMIRSSSVEGWTRLSSKLIKTELDEVSRGQFKFETLYHLLHQELSLKKIDD
jgi:hypothetical protein